MDIRSLHETTAPQSDDSLKKGQSPYLTLLFEQVTETDTPGTYDCVGSLAHRGTKETVEFPAMFTIEGDTFQMEAEINGQSFRLERRRLFGRGVPLGNPQNFCVGPDCGESPRKDPKRGFSKSSRPHYDIEISGPGG